MKVRKSRKIRPKGACDGGSVRIVNEILNSEAYRALATAAELKLLHGFLRRRRWDKRRKVYENAEITYPVAAMCWEADVSRQNALRARDVLVELGLVDVVHRSAGLRNEPNRYRITQRYLRWDPDPAERKRKGFEEAEMALRQNAGKNNGRAENLERNGSHREISRSQKQTLQVSQGVPT